MERLKNKVVLVTGGSGGIGSEICRLCVSEGAKVIINYNSDSANALKLAKELGSHAIAIQADVTDPNAVHSMVQQALNLFKSIDVLVNNASGPILPKRFQTLEWSDVQKDITVHLGGSFYCIQSVLPSMIQQKKGSIINILSTYALGKPPVMLSSYVSAKSALMGLSKSLASELAAYQIRVNMVSPGITQTDAIAHLSEETLRQKTQEIPLKRIATPKEIAQTIVFLASDESQYLTGSNIVVSGGSIMPCPKPFAK